MFFKWIFYFCSLIWVFVLLVRIKSYHKKNKKFKTALITSLILLLLLWIVITSKCVNSVQIRRYFCSVFSCFRTEYGEIRSINPYSLRIQENTYQKFRNFSHSVYLFKYIYWNRTCNAFHFIYDNYNWIKQNRMF